jgi:predicted nucleotidyltransferase
LLSALSDRPNVHQLERFLARRLATRGEEIEFVVLFGSMARGNWSWESDYDLLIGLRGADGKRLTDRIGELEALAEGDLQLFPYDRPAWERMFARFHLLLLEALDHGIVLFDRGAFAAMRATFRDRLARGVVERLDGGWRVAEPTGR